MKYEKRDCFRKILENDPSLSDNPILEIKTGSDWIDESKKKPIPAQLFGKFWFEGEICILYADANLGKSILAVQIADAISRGGSIHCFSNESFSQKVLYLDFELSPKQFEKRYSQDYIDHYQWHSNFIRAEIKQDLDFNNSTPFEEAVLKSIKIAIADHQIKVVILDNITFLGTDNEKGKSALKLMKSLKRMAGKLAISMLILAHTPKRNCYAPLSKNDLSGSRQIMNFCDSAFAIGQSSLDQSYRYLKQIKQRNTECVYHSQNVPVFEIQSINSFLGFHFIKFDDEISHLKQQDSDGLEARDELILQMKGEGLPNTEIARRLGVSEGTVRNRLKKIEK